MVWNFETDKWMVQCEECLSKVWPWEKYKNKLTLKINVKKNVYRIIDRQADERKRT